MFTRHRSLAHLARAALLGLAALSAAPEPLSAQYFGRNKVQYRTFAFRTLQTEHFDIYFYPEEEVAVRDAARMAERWYARLSDILDHEFEERQPLVLYANHPEFQQTTVLGGDISEGTGGVTEAFQQRVIMPFAYSYEETDHVLGHELVHAFQYDISGLGRAGGGIEAAARRFAVPGWFVEGMAEYLSVGPVDPLTAIWLRNAAISGEIPTIEQLSNDPRIFPYRYGQALWAYIGGRWGDATIGQILRLTGQGVPFPEAFERVLNITLDDLSADWQAAVRRAYLPLVAERPEAREVARPLITSTGRGGRLNVAPSLSPDGRWVVFLSELEFLDVELHLANAETGEVVRTLQEGTAFDPHFGSLRYIHSAGTWSPDSRQFAFGALRDGRDVLVLIDVQRGDRTREIAINGVGEITNPTWSPDGQTIVFSGLSGGISDLYAVDLTSGQTRKLTDDRFADLQPAYSADGRSIAFVTDRFGTDLDQLTYGNYRLAVMEVGTAAVRPVPGTEQGAKNINPQWTRDGTGLYFISNRSGIPNIYRVELASGALSQITNIFSGVSGITDVSPALTAARNSDRVLFTAFEQNGYNIYALTEARQLAGTPATATSDAAATTAALLPPVPRPAELAFNRVTAMLNNATRGLPSAAQAAAYPVVDYRPRLALNYLGQPQIGVSTGNVFGGTGFYGGIAGIFSDVLGRHNLAGFIQAQGQLDEIGFAVQYINTRTRWNYGVGAQRLPLIYGYYSEGMTSPSTYAQQIVRLRLFDTSLQGIAQYPFSQVSRAEFSAGLRRIAQDQQIYEIEYQVQGNQIFGGRENIRDEEGVAYNLAEASAAMVYDNALLGYTSPFAGQRYRFEITPTIGELQYIAATADYRRYFYARPFTLAVRGLHFGRYGRNSEPVDDAERLLGINNYIYLGQPSLVRGYYDTYSDCRNSAQGTGASTDCLVLNQLFGSRIAVTSAEIRFPLIRQLVIGTSFGLPPIEGIAFYDAGIAWARDVDPVFERFNPANSDPNTAIDPFSPTGERRLLTSAGVGARVNLFGYLILEIDYVNPFERKTGWQWQFNFQPGF